MRNLMAIAAVAALVGCAETPCETAADLKAACAAPGSTSDQQVADQLPECADESTEACVATCEIDREEDLCAILDRTAEAKAIQGYIDCLEACTRPPDL